MTLDTSNNQGDLFSRHSFLLLICMPRGKSILYEHEDCVTCYFLQLELEELKIRLRCVIGALSLPVVGRLDFTGA